MWSSTFRAVLTQSPGDRGSTLLPVPLSPRAVKKLLETLHALARWARTSFHSCRTQLVAIAAEHHGVMGDNDVPVPHYTLPRPCRSGQCRFYSLA